MLRRDNPADIATARDFFKQAIAKDPTYGLAHAHLAFSLVMLGGYGWAPLDVLSQAQDLATKAIMLSRDQPTGHRVLSFTQMYMRDHAGAEHSLRRALELNPYDAESIDRWATCSRCAAGPSRHWHILTGLSGSIPFIRHGTTMTVRSHCIQSATTPVRWPPSQPTAVLPPWMRTILAACLCPAR